MSKSELNYIYEFEVVCKTVESIFWERNNNTLQILKAYISNVNYEIDLT